MRKEFKDGANYLELANKYGYTENYIRRIVHRKLVKKGEKK
jgi:Mor family transcriptional regulator